MGRVAVGPLDRWGVFVVEVDVAYDLLGQIGFGSKNAAGYEIALNFGEPDFDLVEPGGVGRGVMEMYSAAYHGCHWLRAIPCRRRKCESGVRVSNVRPTSRFRSMYRGRCRLPSGLTSSTLFLCSLISVKRLLT